MVVRSESPDAAFYLLPVQLFEKCLSWFIKSEEEPKSECQNHIGLNLNTTTLFPDNNSTCNRDCRWGLSAWSSDEMVSLFRPVVLLDCVAPPIV
jgi:hypothetical protein